METTDALVHARFAPDGSVIDIDERPAWARPQQWFDLLSRNTVNAYRALAGGRGVFQLPRAELESLKAAPVQ